MAVASLSKFSVPIAAQGATNQTLLMPKLKYRFRVMFKNFAGYNLDQADHRYEMTRQVMTVSRPQVTMANQVIDVFNSKINFAGKPVWNPITVKLRDDITNQTSKVIARQMQIQFDFLEQASAISGQSYKFEMGIEILDGGNGAYTPKILEEWRCLGCYIESVNYNGLSYAEQGPVEIDFTVRPDNCVLTLDNNVTEGHTLATGVNPGDGKIPWDGAYADPTARATNN